MGPILQRKLQATSRKSLLTLKEEQKAIDAQIETLIQADRRLRELFDLIVSVPGVGAATATAILVATNELKTINDPKKMARATSAVMQALLHLNIAQEQVCGEKPK